MWRHRLLRPLFSRQATHLTTVRAASTPLISSADSPSVQKRPSRRRFSAFNRTGRSQRVKELIENLKLQDEQAAKRSFALLPPRERLDIVRALHNKRKKRRQDRASSRLPRYRSPTFERHYYFKEEDLLEESTLGRGPGGQATNRRMQTVILQHKPTGLIVKFSRFPSLWLNRRAARELMSLRLEERLLGPESQLGRRRAARELRKARRGRVIAYLTKKGKKIEERQTERMDVHGFLRNNAPLPRVASAQLGPALADRPVFVKSLFDEECQSLWPILSHAFAQANPALTAPAAATTATVTAHDAMPSFPHPPLVFYFMFPASVKTEATAAEREQLALCASDPSAQETVRQGFQCFVELFGLRVLRKSAPKDVATVRVTRDGMNFMALRGRLHTRDGKSLTPFARATVTHVHRSLLSLGLAPEAQSLAHFFRHEARRGPHTRNEERLWAEEARQLLAGSAAFGSGHTEEPNLSDTSPP